MSWSLSASGHAADADNERSFLDRLRAALTHEHAGASSATVYTQHHGKVDLMTEDATTAEPTAQPTAPAVAGAVNEETAGSVGKVEAAGQRGDDADSNA